MRWFVDGRVNLAHHCLDRRVERSGSRRALVWESERGERRELTWAELRTLTDAVARALQGLGVEPGDTVGLFMPMTPEAVAAYYACAKLGAIAMPIFSGFGAEALAARLVDAEARVLVTADGFPRAGKEVDMKSVADQARELAPTVERVLVLRRLGNEVPWDDRFDVAWEEAVSQEPEPFDAISLDASHPLELMYTSGTTGRPKGALHTHGGMLAIVARDAAYGLDLRDSDILTWPTDLGWIMGPWTIAAAGVMGAQLCLIEGSPMAPMTRLFESAERNRTTVLAIGPSVVRGLMSAGEHDLRSRYDLESLRVLATGGEPIPPDAYEWLLREVGAGRLPIVNLSGGTEVGGCFLIPMPIEGLKASSLGGPALGMDIAVFDDDGNELGPGQVGELVCRSVWPGMTQGLWNDPDRFLETYWTRFPGVWTHGDWASFDEDGAVVSARPLRRHPQRRRAENRPGRGRSRSAHAERSAGRRRGADAARDQGRDDLDCSSSPSPAPSSIPRNSPSRPRACSASRFGPTASSSAARLPRTRSGKIVRRAIRAAALGEDPGDLSTLEDPGAIDGIKAALS